MQGGSEISIAALTPFMANGARSYIRGRISDKSQIREFQKKNGDGSGKLFSCVINDRESSIRATFFNGAVDQVYHTLENGKVYEIGGFHVKAANKQYSRLQNDYELTVDEKSLFFQPANEDTAIPQERFNLTMLQALPYKPKKTSIEVAGVVTDMGKVETINSKSGNVMKKLTFKIAEPCNNSSSGYAVEVSAWNENVDKIEDLKLKAGDVAAFKNVLVSDWNTVSLGFNASSSVVFAHGNDQLREIEARYKTFFNSGEYMNVKELSVRNLPSDGDVPNSKTAFLGRRYLSAIEQEGIGKSQERTDVFDVVCSVSRFGRLPNGPDSLFYVACPEAKCNNKKVDGDTVNGFICTKGCNGHFRADQVNRRYLFQLEICDRVTTKWVNFFEEGGKALFGKSGTEMYNYLIDEIRNNPLNTNNQHSVDGDDGAGGDDRNNNGAADTARILLRYLNVPFMMKIRAKSELYTPRQPNENVILNEDGRAEITKFTVADCEPIKSDRERASERYKVLKAANKLPASFNDTPAEGDAPEEVIKTHFLRDEMEYMVRALEFLAQ